jgi:hypothetical protein
LAGYNIGNVQQFLKNFDSGFCFVYYCSEKEIRAGFDLSDRIIALLVACAAVDWKVCKSPIALYQA